MSHTAIDFSVDFIALRKRIKEGQDKAFSSAENMTIAGRMAALYSSFCISEEKRLFGVMPTGGSGHAHEYRLLFAAPELDDIQLLDWWKYACAALEELVRPDRSHEFSIVSVILATDAVNWSIRRKLRPLMEERRFQRPLAGWAMLRMAVVDLSSRKVYTNRIGDPLRKILQPFL